MARPYIGKVWQSTWTDHQTGEHTPGIAMGGASGMAAHLTSSEARHLADELHDLADQVDQTIHTPISNNP